MGSMDFSLRPMTREDGPAYAELLAVGADSGQIAMIERFEVDPFEALIGVHPDAAGLVAEARGQAGLVGGALVRFGHCQWEGAVVPSGLLNTVVVHPGFRRRGLASRLEQAAAQSRGDDGVFYAVIQHGNLGSERAAGKWARQIVRDRLAVVPLRMRSTRPGERYVVRAARPEDLASAAERMNEFHRDYNLYPPETAASLAAWLDRTPFGTPYRHYRVATNQRGDLLAGMAVTETHRLRTTVLTRVPTVLRTMNLVFRVVPPSGLLKEVTVSRAWFEPGQGMAMRQLLESARWEWREVGTSLVLTFDVRSPMKGICGVRPWSGTMIAGLALRAPTACSEGRLFYMG